MILTSDPLLSSLRPKAAKQRKPFSKEVVEMLLPEGDQEENDDNDSQEEDSDEDEYI